MLLTDHLMYLHIYIPTSFVMIHLCKLLTDRPTEWLSITTTTTTTSRVDSLSSTKLLPLLDLRYDSMNTLYVCMHMYVCRSKSYHHIRYHLRGLYASLFHIWHYIVIIHDYHLISVVSPPSISIPSLGEHRDHHRHDGAS